MDIIFLEKNFGVHIGVKPQLPIFGNCKTSEELKQNEQFIVFSINIIETKLRNDIKYKNAWKMWTFKQKWVKQNSKCFGCWLLDAFPCGQNS